ncbi:MAG: hypothetical protein GTO13_07305 [Proteobacteria bacterium]|nr:hypothetical protein [Pseudomonadota bacterium]
MAHLLAKGMLRRVWVPRLEERYRRQVIRRRGQLMRIVYRLRTASRLIFESTGYILIDPFW